MLWFDVILKKNQFRTFEVADIKVRQSSKFWDFDLKFLQLSNFAIREHT